MPTYEYACKACGEHTEVRQSVKDEPLLVCSSCGGPLRKVFGAIGIAFKGSGFYRTDSRGSSKSSEDRAAKADGKADGKDSSRSDSKDDSKGDSKAKPSEPAKSSSSASKPDAKSA